MSRGQQYYNSDKTRNRNTNENNIENSQNIYYTLALLLSDYWVDYWKTSGLVWKSSLNLVIRRGDIITVVPICALWHTTARGSFRRRAAAVIIMITIIWRAWEKPVVDNRNGVWMFGRRRKKNDSRKWCGDGKKVVCCGLQCYVGTYSSCAFIIITLHKLRTCTHLSHVLDDTDTRLGWKLVPSLHSLLNRKQFVAVAQKCTQLNNTRLWMYILFFITLQAITMRYIIM